MKKTLKNLAGGLLFLALTLALSLVPQSQKLDAKAYYYGMVSSSSIRQTSYAKKTLSITWAAEADAARYDIYYKNAYDYDADFVKAGSTTATTYTISSLSGGQSYTVKIVPFSAAGEEGYGTTKYDLITLPDKITNLHQEQWWYWLEKVDIQWDRLPAVDGYEVSFYNGKGKRIKKKTITSSSQNYISFDVGNQVYTTKVRAFKKINGKKYYSSTATCYSICQARVSSAKVSGGKLKIKWKKITGATGYNIYISTKKNSGYKKVKSVSKNTTSVTLKKFKNKSFKASKTYYIYVVTKKKVGKKTYNSGALYYWNSKNTSYGYLD